MYLLGQALFSRHLLTPFEPRTIETVAVCTKGDSVLEPIALAHGREFIFDYSPPEELKVSLQGYRLTVLDVNNIRIKYEWNKIP